MSLVDRVNRGVVALRGQPEAERYSLDDLAEMFTFGGNTYPLMQTTMGSVDEEKIIGTANGGFKSNGPVFALVMARLQAFSQVRFQWTQFVGSQPSDLFGTPELSVLERPWPGGTTSDLLARMEIHASVAGCAYIIRPKPNRLSMLRPDRVTIVLGSQTDADDPSEAPDAEIVGYIHRTQRGEITTFLANEVAYYAPIPDPDYRFLGMSWITPVIREMQADGLATEHKARFFQNAAPQPYDAGVLTPDGWVEMGEINVGDRVFGPDGKPREVIGCYPQGVQDIYRVTFSSGASTECTADHLWTVANAYDRKRGITRTLPLSALVADGIRYDSGPRKWSVPLVDPLEFDDARPLPLHPYLLGSLLGDGSFRSNGKGSGVVSMASHRDDADEQQETLTGLLPDGVSIRSRDRGRWSEFCFNGPGQPKPNPLTRAVRDLGLFDVPGREKFIPEPYLRASITERIALMQGLIDTDGNVDRRQPNTVRFDSTSERLARGLGELASSLGAVVTVRPITRSDPGRRPQWHVVISRLPEWIVPCRLARKAEVYSPAFRGGRWRYIQSVEHVGRKPAKCIKVDSTDHLYVTDDFILTHNTPNMAIKFDPSVSVDNVRKFKAILESEHQGVWNAYKTLYLGGGADPVVIGKDFQQLDFAATQGKGESRLAAAAGVPPSWVGFSEGLQGSSLNAGNFQAARRRFSDGTMYHLWTSAATALETLVRPPNAYASLWFDDRVPFMREDAADLAAIQAQQAATIGSYITQGFIPKTAVKAVMNNDPNLLEHSGMVSVQLLPPGAEPPGQSGDASSNGKASKATGVGQ